MTADFPATDRCPKCGATVRFGDPWCTLCYADLRPPAPAPVEPAPAADPPAYSPAPAVSGPDPLTAPLESVAGQVTRPVTGPVTGPSWPCPACSTVNPMANDICAACGRHFLAGLRDDSPLLELPVVGDLTRFGRGQRVAIAFGVILAVVLLTILVGSIFG